MKQTIFTYTLAAAVLCCCIGCNKTYKMGTYAFDREFLAKHGFETIELCSADGQSKVLIAPGMQGRVMTSTTDGDAGTSYGWINYKFIEKGDVSPQFNPYGGEERFWIGPEGGAFSWYFKKGQEQVYENWRVPSIIDTDAYDIETATQKEAVFTKEFTVRNASDIEFSIAVRRAVIMEDNASLAALLGVQMPEGLKVLGYRTENTLTNKGPASWTKETGMPSVWLLGTFNPTPTTTVFIPCNILRQSTCRPPGL